MIYKGSDYSDSQPGGILPPRSIWRYLLSEDIFGCHKWQDAMSIYSVEANAVKHHTICKKISENKELPDPKCQKY